MIKFIHTGDLHLASSFKTSNLRGDKAKKRRQELVNSFKNIIDYAKEKRVDLILISGDFFEYKYVNQGLLREIIGIINKISFIPIFISPGNHDLVLSDSYYLTSNWPENVHIFKKEEWEKVILKEKGLNVYGLGWQRRHIKESLLDNLKVEAKKGEVNLVCVHGDCLNLQNPYLPLNKEKMAELEVDYWALGHIHQRQELVFKGKLKGAYAGSPEPLNTKEQGQHGFYYGTIEEKKLSLEFIPFASREYLEIEILLTEDDTYDSIREKIGQTLNKSANIYRLILQGLIDPSLDLDVNLLKEDFKKEVFHLDIIDQTNPFFDLQLLKENHQGDLIALYIQEMENMIAQGNKEEKVELQKALYYGLDALLGRKVILR